MKTKAMPLRLALRVEGFYWKAYVAKLDNMDNALLIGSIAMAAVSENPQRKRVFMGMMQEIVMEVLQKQGLPVKHWNEPAAAPEHEREKPPMRSSDAKLAAALREAGLPEHAKKAEQGYFNEFFGPLEKPMLTLVHDLVLAGTKEAFALRERVVNGEFDAGADESEEWACSKDGQDAIAELIKGRQ